MFDLLTNVVMVVRMTLQDYRYIATIYEYRNITKAAEMLYISQPSLSIALHKLEQKLGCKLFERGSKQLIPTYAGEQFVEYAKKIIRINEECDSLLKEIAQSGGQAETIHVGFTNSLSMQLFPKIIKLYSENWPLIKVILHEGRGKQLEEMVLPWLWKDPFTYIVFI